MSLPRHLAVLPLKLPGTFAVRLSAPRQEYSHSDEAVDARVEARIVSALSFFSFLFDSVGSLSDSGNAPCMHANRFAICLVPLSVLLCRAACCEFVGDVLVLLKRWCVTVFPRAVVGSAPK